MRRRGGSWRGSRENPRGSPGRLPQRTEAAQDRRPARGCLAWRPALRPHPGPARSMCPAPPARPGPHSQHDPRDVQPHRDAPVFEGSSDEAAEGERRHHAQREGEQRVRPRQHRVHRGRDPRALFHTQTESPFPATDPLLAIRAACAARVPGGARRRGPASFPVLRRGRARAHPPPGHTHQAAGTRRKAKPESLAGPPLLPPPISDEQRSSGVSPRKTGLFCPCFPSLGCWAHLPSFLGLCVRWSLDCSFVIACFINLKSTPAAKQGSLEYILTYCVWK